MPKNSRTIAELLALDIPLREFMGPGIDRPTTVYARKLHLAQLLLESLRSEMLEVKLSEHGELYFNFSVRELPILYGQALKYLQKELIECLKHEGPWGLRA